MKLISPARLRSAVAHALRLALTLVPATRLVVVHGYPVSEGNAVQTLRALSSRYPGRIVWLVDDVESKFCRVVQIPRVEIRKKNSVSGLSAYLRAECVFYTHGLYGSPRPVARKAFVNLWHGDGPKRWAARKEGGTAIPGTYMVGSSRLFTSLRAKAFGYAEAAVILSGQPRNDRLSLPTSKASLESLGIRSPFVVWMPTFRQSRDLGATAAWSDLAAPSVYDVNSSAHCLALSLKRAGLQLVVKPHPMDAESRDIPGSVLIDHETLNSAGVELYSLLAASAGLITDYSSVYMDYLLLDRPIGFMVPDRTEYTNGRGVEPADALTWLPGTTLDQEMDIEAFVADCLSGGNQTRHLREVAMERSGLVAGFTAADDLLRELDRRGVLRFR